MWLTCDHSSIRLCTYHRWRTRMSRRRQPCRASRSRGIAGRSRTRPFPFHGVGRRATRHLFSNGQAQWMSFSCAADANRAGRPAPVRGCMFAGSLSRAPYESPLEHVCTPWPWRLVPFSTWPWSLTTTRGAQVSRLATGGGQQDRQVCRSVFRRRPCGPRASYTSPLVYVSFCCVTSSRTNGK